MTELPECKSVYLPFECEIVDVSQLTPGEKLFRVRRLDGKPLGHVPGQFVQVSLLGLGEAPISVASSPTRGVSFELGVRSAGTLTSTMHHMKAGDSFGMRGPFGRPFDLSRLRGHDLLLICGGCGLAPMRSLIQYCEDRPEEFSRISILYGAKTPAHTLFKDELAAWNTSGRFACSLTVDDSAGECHYGNVGRITALIPPLSIVPENTFAVIIGPPPMYQAVIDELAGKGLHSDRIMVSLERQMRCGVGKCGHCCIEHLTCCQDGPVFWLNEIEHLRGAL